MAGFGESLTNALLGTPDQFQQIPRLSTQQIGLQNSLGGAAQQLLPRVQQGFDFAPIAQQARSQFATQTIPSLAERFTALGGQNSSAFQGALGQAGAGLDQGLAALGSQYGLQAQGQQQNLLTSLLGLALQPQHENIFMPGQQGLLQQAGAPLAGALGNYGISGLASLIQWLFSGRR